MDFAAIHGMDLTPVATILIAVGLAGMWLGRPSAVSASAPGSGGRHGAGGWHEAVAAIAALLGLGARAARPAAAMTASAPAVAVIATARPRSVPARLGRRRARAQVAAPPLAARIPLDRQWSTLETRISAAVAGAGNAARMQATALVNLDAADYALTQLMRDLDDVLKPRPAASVAPIRPQATKLRPTMPIAA